MNRHSIVLTLIHGTYGQESEWTSAASDFSIALERAFEGRGFAVRLERADWNGANSHTSRLDAVEKVDDRLRNIRIWNPDSYHFVIAHSHGGTVLRYAIRNGYNPGKLSGYVTLGTPFISCRPRNIEWATRRFAFPFFLLFYPLLFLSFHRLASSLVISNLLSENAPSPHEILAVVLIFASLFVSTFAAVRITIWLINLLRKDLVIFGCKASAETSERLNTSGTPLPHLCLSNADDEAASLLGTFRTIANLPTKCITLFLWLFPYVAGATLAALVLMLVFGHEGLALLADNSSQVAQVLGGFTVFIFLMMVLAVFGPKFSRALPFAFGGETVLDNLFSDILSTPVPVDTPCTALNIMDINRPLTPTWSISPNHSAFFHSPTATKTITDWIIETIEKAVGSPDQPSAG